MKNLRNSSIWGGGLGGMLLSVTYINTLIYTIVVNQLPSEYLQIDYIVPLLWLSHNTISVSELQDGTDVTSQ